MLLTNQDYLYVANLTFSLFTAASTIFPIVWFQVKRAGSLLLGGAAQSHPEVQAAAVQAGARIKFGAATAEFSQSLGVLPLLLRLIHLDGDARVAARALYALSSLLR